MEILEYIIKYKIVKNKEWEIEINQSEPFLLIIII